MARKKKEISSLLRYLLIVPSIFSLASHLVSLVKQEYIIMRQKLTSLLLASIFCFMFASGMWISLLTFLGIYLISLNLSLIFAVTLILLLNFFLFCIGVLLIFIIKRNMAFPETQEAIKEIISR